MNEMIERVARAMARRASEPVLNLKSLEPVLVGSLGDAWPYLARAAIEAMREPTEAMTSAPSNANIDFGPGGTGEVQADPLNVWRAMIDAALDDDSTKPAETQTKSGA